MKSLQITQPVLLQSFLYEFTIPAESESPKTPGISQKALRLGIAPSVEGTRNTYYRFRVGKLMHLRRWSGPEMTNAMRDLSPYNSNCTQQYIDAMHRTMRYAITTPNRGLKLASSGVWDSPMETQNSSLISRDLQICKLQTMRFS
jgi:hypothetical protein